MAHYMCLGTLPYEDWLDHHLSKIHNQSKFPSPKFLNYAFWLTFFYCGGHLDMFILLGLENEVYHVGKRVAQL